MVLRDKIRKILKESESDFFVNMIKTYGLEKVVNLLGINLNDLVKLSKIEITPEIMHDLIIDGVSKKLLPTKYKGFSIDVDSMSGVIDWSRKFSVKLESGLYVDVVVYALATPFWNGEMVIPVELDYISLKRFNDEDNHVLYNDDIEDNIKRINIKESIKTVDELYDWYKNQYLPKIYSIIKNKTERIVNDYTRDKIKDFNEILEFKVVGNISKLLKEGNFESGSMDFYTIKSLIKKRVSDVSPFYGVSYNNKLKRDVQVKFNIIPGSHYIERIDRLSDKDYKPGGKYYDPKIVNPELYEGIDLLVRNADRLTKLLFSKIIQDGDVVEFSSTDGSNYRMIVRINSESLDGYEYTLLLKTQIKGTEFFRKNNKKINLY